MCQFSNENWLPFNSGSLSSFITKHGIQTDIRFLKELFFPLSLWAEAHKAYTQKYTSAQRTTYIHAHRAEASIHSVRLHLKKHNSSAVTTQRSGQKQVLPSRPLLRTKFLFCVFSYVSMLLSATVVIALNKEI